MTTRTVGIGIIGMGWMGQVHSRAYLQVADRFWDIGIRPRLVVCADEVAARAQEAQTRFGFARCATDWRAVVEDPEVEVVNITAPNFMHRQMVEAVAQAGKHIFCEKPVGRSPEETAAIAASAQRAGVLTWVGYNYRWAPLVQYAQRLIQEGRLGRLTHFRGRFFAGYVNNPHAVLSWRMQSELAGLGALGDIMSHVLDLAHFLAGPVARTIGNRRTFIPQRPVAMAGQGTHFSVGGGGPLADVTNEDYAAALVQFANGAQGTLEVCRVISGPKCQLAFEVHGTQGALRWDFERMNELEVFLPEGKAEHDGYATLLSAPEHPFHTRYNPGPGIGLGYDDLKGIETSQFLQSVLAGQQGQPGFREAVAVAEVQAAILRSWDSERWETVQPL